MISHWQKAFLERALVLHFEQNLNSPEIKGGLLSIQEKGGGRFGNPMMTGWDNLSPYSHILVD